jgi:hypothetical protein
MKWRRDFNAEGTEVGEEEGTEASAVLDMG